MSAKAPGAEEGVGKEWPKMEPDSEIKLVRVSGGPRLLLGGISTVDSESFELELHGRVWDTSDSSFVQIPSVVLEIRFRPMFTMSKFVSPNREFRPTVFSRL